MITYVVEGLIKVGAGRWVVWTANGSYAVKDFGHIEEGMLSFTGVDRRRIRRCGSSLIRRHLFLK